jgi:hypothetical protein
MEKPIKPKGYQVSYSIIPPTASGEEIFKIEMNRLNANETRTITIEGKPYILSIEDDDWDSDLFTIKISKPDEAYNNKLEEYYKRYNAATEYETKLYEYNEWTRKQRQAKERKEKERETYERLKKKYEKA